MHTGDVSETARDFVASVLDLGLVCAGHFLEDFCPVEDSESGFGQVVHHWPCPDCRGVHFLESCKGVAAVIFVIEPGHEAVVVEVANRRDGDAFGNEGLRQSPPEVDGRQNVLLALVDLSGGHAEPTLGGYLVWLARMPDVHAAEVRTAGIWVADALDDAKFSRIPEFLQGSGVRVEREVFVNRDEVVLGNA